MSGLIAGLAGAGGSANTAGGYYQNAANNVANEYQSPAANKFSQEFISSLQPGFSEQQQGLLGNLAAHGITNSGAAKADLTNLYTGESAAEAGGVAPLYSQALDQYGNIIGQEPGAQNQAYQQAIDNFYTALQQAGSFAGDAMGVPSQGPGAPPNAASYGGTEQQVSNNPYGGGYTFSGG